jgi:hypothetical protein
MIYDFYNILHNSGNVLYLMTKIYKPHPLQRLFYTANEILLPSINQSFTNFVLIDLNKRLKIVLSSFDNPQK